MPWADLLVSCVRYSSFCQDVYRAHAPAARARAVADLESWVPRITSAYQRFGAAASAAGITTR